ncbi:FHA domain-containing protein [Parachlamydia sp. AcF125]|uniref:FHA domain-containing protein n=1 Tax=Parachlamydia sp. AcF125 TaxID=2795736 RepID=UPI001BC9AE8C|nr:FHA domain-containing protein [Parachlamydia sp. AcF125]MBS4167397.1 hypothetical protein [Parachlamydia sp. AcF125]
MIKLTVQRKNNQIEEFVFEKSSIKIGEGGEEIDLSLSEESLHPCHVEIYEHDGFFYIFNRANDPFVALNELPFRKKSLCGKDVLMVGKTRIEIEAHPAKKNEEVLSPTGPLISQSESKHAHSEGHGTANLQKSEILPPPPTLEEANQQEFSLYAPQNPSKRVNEDPSLEIVPPQHVPEGSLSLSSLAPKPCLAKNEELKAPLSMAQKSWRFTLSLGAMILAFITLLSGIAYLKFNNESDRDEIKAAQAVADAAMALSYAQMARLKPHKSNWSQPEFLKTSLAPILPLDTKPLIDVDAQGKFKNCPYLLRIYTSGDLSHFLVIAQPAPSTLQWLLPRSAIVLDSASMEMRKTADLKNLNRLLVNINSLDELNSNEIFNIAKEGKLIRLSSLKLSKRVREFTPPKALSLLRPGAENYIYNAPRYHRFGENILNKAIALLEGPVNDQQVSALKQDIEALKKLPNLVLYTTKGIEGALQAEKALSIFVPNTPFLIGYLKLSSQGNIIQNSMLMNEEIGPASGEAATDKPVNKDIKVQGPLSIAAENTQAPPSHLHSNPVYLQLDKLFNNRKNALHPIHTKMEELISKERIGTTSDFHPQFQELLKEHEKIALEQREIFKEAFFKLQEEYWMIPLKEWMEYIQATGLTPLVEDILVDLPKENFLSPGAFENALRKIRDSHNFDELYSQVKEITAHLSLNFFPSIQRLIEYQNTYKNEVIIMIDKFLLSSGEKLTVLSSSTQEILDDIFKLIWVNSPTEREFYLHELNLLIQETESKKNLSEPASLQQILN